MKKLLLMLFLIPFVSHTRAQEANGTTTETGSGTTTTEAGSTTTETGTEPTEPGWDYTTTDEVENSSNKVYTMTLNGKVSTIAAGTTNTDIPGLSITFGATGDKNWTIGQLIDNNDNARNEHYYAQAGSTLALDDIVPNHGGFYVFKPAVSGKLTLTYSGWKKMPARWVEVNTNRNKVTSFKTPTSDFGEMTQYVFVIGGKTYYFYGNDKYTNYPAHLNSVSFEPSFLKAGGSEQVLNNAILDAPTLGEAVDMPFLSVDGSVKVTKTLKEKTYDVNPTGDIVLISKTVNKIGAKCTIPTTTAFPETGTLAYYFNGINANDNAYVVDKGASFKVGQALTTTNGGGSMYLGGWQYGASGEANSWTSSEGKTKADSWKQAVGDDSGTDDQGLFRRTLDGFLYSTAGANDAYSETRGAFDDSNKRTSLPCRGAYVMFEPEKKGTLSVYILQNGSINTFNDDKNSTTPNDYGWTGKNDDFTGEIAWRPFYIKDEHGENVPNVNPTVNNSLTWTFSELQDLQKVQKDKYPNNTPQLYFYKLVNGKRQEVNNGDPEYDLMKGALDQTRTNGADIAIHVHNTNDGGYMVIQKSYVKYEFPVLPGKTYFIFSNTSKLGFCGYKFVADADQTAQTVSLDNKATSFSAPTDKLVSVTLNRIFKKDQWTTLCLPFSLSAKQMRDVFGDAVVLDEVKQVAQQGEQVTVDGQTSTMNRNTIVMIHHVYDQMVAAGVPYLIKPAKDVTKPSFTAVYFPSTAVSPETVNCTHGYTWKGVFSNEPMGTGDYYVGSKDGNFKYYTTDGHESYSFRSYLDFDISKADAKSMVFGATEFGFTDVNTTTGISSLSVITPEDMDPRAFNTGKIYNLQGQVVSNDSRNLDRLPAGIYIVNGKKELVK